MNQDDEPVFAPDDGTPLHALAELRRAMCDRYDKTSGEVLHAVDRAQSAVIQADGAKTSQEEMRHLIRALAAASELFILTPKKIQETYRDVLERLQRQVENLAAAIPAMPPTPNELYERVAAMTDRIESFLSHCEQKTANVEKGLAANVTALTDRLRAAAEDLQREAGAAATQGQRRDARVLIVGVILGVFAGASAARLWTSALVAGKTRGELRWLPGGERQADPQAGRAAAGAVALSDRELVSADKRALMNRGNRGTDPHSPQIRALAGRGAALHGDGILSRRERPDRPPDTGPRGP